MILEIILVVAAVISPAICIILFSRRIRDLRMNDSTAEAELRESYERRILLMQQQMQQQMQLQSEEIRQQSKAEFELLANRVLQDQKQSMEQANSRQMEQILSPLRTKLDEFNATVTNSYIKENAARQSLSDQIERLMKLNHTIGEEAHNLTKALRGDSKVQGDWGETILESLLEQAGLKRDINFTVQLTEDESGASLRDEDGHLRRPDIVVFLPENRNIIIDSKVSLTAFVDIIEADNEDTRRAATRRLVESVRRHVGELAMKRYQKLVKNSADHVLMFMPNEGAYFAAVSADPSLWDYAFKHNVVIVSPTHIFSVMQLVSQIWRGEKQNRNAAEIARLGGLIFDKIAAFTREMENIQKGIRTTETAYENCLRHLTTGSTSIIARTRRMRDLGAKTSSRLSASVEEAATLNASLPESVHNPSYPHEDTSIHESAD